MRQYLDLLHDIRLNGVDKQDRTGTGTRSVFGRQMRFNLQDGFPLLTTKKLHLKSIIHELLWFLKGDTNVKYLQENGVKIWDDWADANGELGPVYGAQWRSWRAAGDPYTDTDVLNATATIDQISDLVTQLKNNPDSRRLIVSAWNPGEVDKMALPPCHCLFQFYTRPLTHEARLSLGLARSDVVTALRNYALPDAACADTMRLLLDNFNVPTRALDCQLYQRSADSFLGVPFNIASYALLTMMLAQVTGMVAGDFVHTLGDTHIYHNHFNQVATQLARRPKELPRMILNPKVSSIFDFKYEDFTLEGYLPDPAIPAPIAV